MNRKFTTVTIPVTLHDRLKRISKQNHRSMAGQVAVFVEREEKKLDTLSDRTTKL